MRLQFTIVAALIATFSLAQNPKSQRDSIISDLERIGKMTNTASTDFNIRALKKVPHYIQYLYVESKKQYITIERRFAHQEDSIWQTFYLKNNQLIYATEQITSYYANEGQTDTMTWMGSFYFYRGKLIDHITLGHGKSEIDTWDPQSDMLTAFRESLRDIDRYKKADRLKKPRS